MISTHPAGSADRKSLACVNDPPRAKVSLTARNEPGASERPLKRAGQTATIANKMIAAMRMRCDDSIMNTS
jgi:hypothetical protein